MKLYEALRSFTKLYEYLRIFTKLYEAYLEFTNIFLNCYEICSIDIMKREIILSLITHMPHALWR